ncbi:MAG: hypothetical protein Q8Q09_23805 [Deltaproteobacteria bacterium]|nr:hypothetical protein [Deltaproteobacteria bacterium]
MKPPIRLIFPALLLAVSACETPRPGNDVTASDAQQESSAPDVADVTVAMDVTEASVSPDAGDSSAEAASDADASDVATDVVSNACMPASTDFQPRSAGARMAPWDQCMAVTSAETFPVFNAAPSASARMRAVDVLDRPGGFFDPTRDPTPDEFAPTMPPVGMDTSANGLLTSTGIATRYQRRADEHYAPPAGLVLDSTYQDFCGPAANWMAHRDYCTSPATLNPVLTASLANGMGGGATPSRVFAARIQGTLQWWTYMSTYKEALTCAPVVADCDAAFGYYTGGSARSEAAQYGLARSLLALGTPGREAHDRIWDGLLAVRCWRDLDGGRTTPPVAATNEALREQVRTQLDRALTRGIVLLTQARLRSFASTDGDAMRAAERQAHAAWIGVVGPLLSNGLQRWSRGWWAQQRATAPAAVVSRLVTELSAGEAITTAQAGRASADLEAILRCP